MEKRTDADPLAHNQLRVTCEHEAAHAVIYLLQGVELATVGAGDDWATTPAGPPLRELLQVATVAVAGPLIEARYSPAYDFHEKINELAELFDGVGADDEEAAGHDLMLFTKHLDYLEPAITVATFLLEHHSDMHAEIANALWDAPNHTLTGNDLLALPITGEWQARARTASRDTQGR